MTRSLHNQHDGLTQLSDINYWEVSGMQFLFQSAYTDTSRKPSAVKESTSKEKVLTMVAAIVRGVQQLSSVD